MFTDSGSGSHIQLMGSGEGYWSMVFLVGDGRCSESGLSHRCDLEVGLLLEFVIIFYDLWMHLRSPLMNWGSWDIDLDYQGSVWRDYPASLLMEQEQALAFRSSYPRYSYHQLLYQWSDPGYQLSSRSRGTSTQSHVSPLQTLPLQDSLTGTSFLDGWWLSSTCLGMDLLMISMVQY